MLEHIGIAVSDLVKAKKTYEDILEVKALDIEVVSEEKVRLCTVKSGNLTIELLEGTSDDSPVSRFVKSRGKNSIHHLAIRVDNIDSKVTSLKEKGYEILKGYPRNGREGTRVAFLHPASTNGVLIELVEEIT